MTTGSFARLAIRDFRHGGRQVAGRIAAILLGVNVLCFLLFYLMATGKTVVNSLTFADYVSSCVGGLDASAIGKTDTFKLPAGWLCLCAGIAYVVLDYPIRDLSATGAQSMAAAGGRLPWWLAKCCWTALTCLFVWMGILTICAIWALVFGTGAAPGALKLTPGVPVLLGFDAPLALTEDMSTGFALFLVTFPLVACSLCLLQAALSMTMAPLASFAVTVAILFLSAFILNPALPGNYLMIARCDFASAAGLSPLLGLLVAAALGVAAVAGGAQLCLHRDIYGREARDND